MAVLFGFRFCGDSGSIQYVMARKNSLLCIGITPILGIRGVNQLVVYNILQNLFFPFLKNFLS